MSDIKEDIEKLKQQIEDQPPRRPAATIHNPKCPAVTKAGRCTCGGWMFPT